MATMNLTLAQARRAWVAHQHGGSFTQVPGGWLRALGGVDPYLALRARDPGLTRPALDGALAAGTVRVVPGVRGCIWLSRAQDVPLALRVAAAHDHRRIVRELDGLGVGPSQRAALMDAALAAIGDGALTPREIAAQVAADLNPSLGEAGKKKGLSTPLPSALRLLELAGRIERIAPSLATNRYAWRAAASDPFGLGPDPGGDAKAQATALARHYLRHAAPADLDAFREWSNLGKRAAEQALQAVGAVPVTVAGEPAFALPEQLEGLTHAPPSGILLIPGLDNLCSMQRPARLADGAHHGVPLPKMMGRGTMPLGEVRWLHNRPILEDGVWIGLWGYDLDARRVITGYFAAPDAARRAAVDRAAEALTAFIRDELADDVRSYDIDSEAKIRARDALVRDLVS